jgi:hypothetical protein
LGILIWHHAGHDAVDFVNDSMFLGVGRCGSKMSDCSVWFGQR